MTVYNCSTTTQYSTEQFW